MKDFSEKDIKDKFAVIKACLPRFEKLIKKFPIETQHKYVEALLKEFVEIVADARNLENESIDKGEDILNNLGLF